MFSKLAILGAASAALLVFAFAGTRSVSAQYPVPSGNCTLTIDATQVDAGGDAGVTVTVLDASSNPRAGVTVTVHVTQPGSDASVDMNSTTTDSNGQVTGTLHVGTTTGVVSLTANAEDSSCGAQVVVRQVPPVASTAVPQSEVSAEVTLPNTGAGTSADAPSMGLLIVLAVAGGAVIVGGAGLRRTRRR